MRPAVAAAVLVGLLSACAPTPETSLRELVADAEAYDGHEVVVDGSIVAFDEDDGAARPHVVLEDAASNRVLLLPGEAAEAHVGADVEVTGTFTFSPEQGRRLRIADIVER